MSPFFTGNHFACVMPAAGAAAGVTAPQVMNAPSPTEFSNPASTGTVQKCNCLSELGGQRSLLRSSLTQSSRTTQERRACNASQLISQMVVTICIIAKPICDQRLRGWTRLALLSCWTGDRVQKPRHAWTSKQKLTPSMLSNAEDGQSRRIF